jgi:hypothetical protein
MAHLPDRTPGQTVLEITVNFVRLGRFSFLCRPRSGLSGPIWAKKEAAADTFGGIWEDLLRGEVCTLGQGALWGEPMEQKGTCRNLAQRVTMPDETARL